MQVILLLHKVVAGLLCTDLAAGRRASELVRIEYEDLEAVLTIDDAAKRADAVISEAKFEKLQPIDMPPKERVRRTKTTYRVEEIHIILDPCTRLNRPQVRTFRGRVHLGGQEHFYMEPHAVLVVPSGEKDEMTVHASTQDAMTIQVPKMAAYMRSICLIRAKVTLYGNINSKTDLF